jgi:hypothetical protein
MLTAGEKTTFGTKVDAIHVIKTGSIANLTGKTLTVRYDAEYWEIADYLQMEVVVALRRQLEGIWMAYVTLVFTRIS